MEEKCAELAQIFIEAKRIHAFIEGNGRTTRPFLSRLAAGQGIDLDFSRVTPEQWNRASALSAEHGRMFEGMHFIPSKSDPAPIARVFESIAVSLYDSDGDHAVERPRGG